VPSRGGQGRPKRDTSKARRKLLGLAI